MSEKALGQGRIGSRMTDIQSALKMSPRALKRVECGGWVGGQGPV